MEGDEPPVWNVLDQWINEQLAQKQPIQEKQETAGTPAKKDKAPASATQSSPGLSSQPSGPLSSDKELQSATRAIREYLFEKKEYVQAMSYGRALRWGALAVPPNENGRTKIPAMRETGLQGLENAKANHSGNGRIS